jgi:hypothetical protein
MRVVKIAEWIDELRRKGRYTQTHSIWHTVEYRPRYERTFPGFESTRARSRTGAGMRISLL